MGSRLPIELHGSAHINDLLVSSIFGSSLGLPALLQQAGLQNLVSCLTA